MKKEEINKEKLNSERTVLMMCVLLLIPLGTLLVKMLNEDKIENIFLFMFIVVFTTLLSLRGYTAYKNIEVKTL